jgi:hypothetical protein
MWIETAINSLEKRRVQVLADYQRELAEIDTAIENLQRQKTDAQVNGGAETAEQPRLIPVRPGQFKGMKTAAALQAYLNERRGGPVPIGQTVHDLLLADVDLGQPSRHERNLKIVLANNTKQFKYNDGSDSVELVDANK